MYGKYADDVALQPKNIVQQGNPNNHRIPGSEQTKGLMRPLFTMIWGLTGCSYSSSVKATYTRILQQAPKMKSAIILGMLLATAYAIPKELSERASYFESLEIGIASSVVRLMWMLTRLFKLVGSKWTVTIIEVVTDMLERC
jgi:hypothetical protein